MRTTTEATQPRQEAVPAFPAALPEDLREQHEMENEVTTKSYTAIVTTVGEGRNGGRSMTPDGILDVVHAYPVELGGSGAGTNPEQLLGAGWSACFRGALGAVAAERGLRLGNTQVTAEITVTADGSDHNLSAVLKASATGVELPDLEALMEVAHKLCPYSKATAGNIPVELVAL